MVCFDIRLGFFAPLPPRACPRVLSPSSHYLFPGYRSSGVVMILRFFFPVLPASVPVTLRPVGSPMLFFFSLVNPTGRPWFRGWFFVEPRGPRRWWLYFACLFPFGGNSSQFAAFPGLWEVGSFLVSQMCLACIFCACRPAHFWSGAPDRWWWAVEWTEWWAVWRKGGWCSLSRCWS